MTDRTKQIVIIGVGVVLILALLVGFLPAIPSRFFKNEDFRGIRLVKDVEESSLYFIRSRWVSERVLPYRDVFVEYPQLAAAYISWPRLFTQDVFHYGQFLFAANGLVYVGLIVVTARILSLLKYSPKRLLIFFLPAALYFSVNRFDALPALVVQLSFLALLLHRPKWAVGSLVVAGFIKWYAWLLIPLFWCWQRRTTSIKDLLRRFLPSAILSILIIATSFFLFGSKVLDPYRFHVQGRSFGHDTIFTPLIGGVFENGIARALLVVQAAVVLAVAVFGNWLSRRMFSFTSLIRLSLITLLAFMLLAKFYSPQWILWVVPLFIVLPLRRVDYILLVSFDLVSFIQFPVFFDMFGASSGEYFIIVLVRTILTAWLLIRLISEERGAFSRTKSVSGSLEQDQIKQPPPLDQIRGGGRLKVQAQKV